MKRKGTAAKGHTSKHVGTSKHHATSKHHPTRHAKATGGTTHHVATKAKHTTHARGLAVAGEVACCTAEALAASLRLAGWPVGYEDVLALHRLTGADDERGAPILATLETASAFGLAGVRPQWFAMSRSNTTLAAAVRMTATDQAMAVDLAVMPPNLILGVDLPGAHAVLATPGGWWSWGDLWCPCEFPDAVIEEAWVVTWP